MCPGVSWPGSEAYAELGDRPRDHLTDLRGRPFDHVLKEFCISLSEYHRGTVGVTKRRRM